MNQSQNTPEERAALQRLAKQETERLSEQRENRIAELREQLAGEQAEIQVIAEEYAPRITALVEKQRLHQRQMGKAAAQRDKLVREMQGKQAHVRNRCRGGDVELRQLEGRVLPVPKFFEKEEDRRQREVFERELKAAEQEVLKAKGRGR